MGANERLEQRLPAAVAGVVPFMAGGAFCNQMRFELLGATMSFRNVFLSIGWLRARRGDAALPGCAQAGYFIAIR